MSKIKEPIKRRKICTILSQRDGGSPWNWGKGFFPKKEDIRVIDHVAKMTIRE